MDSWFYLFSGSLKRFLFRFIVSMISNTSLTQGVDRMNKIYAFSLGMVFISMGAYAQTEVRLAVHKSFSLPKDALVQFEKDHNAKVSVIKAGSGNEMLNKLILSRAKPIADAVYGLDNINIHKARQAGILLEQQPASLATKVQLPGALPINYGYVVINYDKAWFQQKGLALPKTLDDLTKPAYKNLFVMPNPGTSSPGLAFLIANIGGLGEKQTFEWWAKMRANGVKITQSWSDAYYTEFSRNGGSRPLVVSYATSPAAEVQFGKGKYTTPPTGNLFLKGGVFRQVEGAAVLRHSKQPLLAAKLVQYLQSPRVQQAIPTEMWGYPAAEGTPLPKVFEFAQAPTQYYSPAPQLIASQQRTWVSRWTRTTLK